MIEMRGDLELTNHKIDMAREAVQALHPLLQLLDPEQTDITMEFAERLIGLLINNEEQLENQARAFELQAAEMRRLRAQMTKMQASLNFLAGDPSQGLNG